MEAVYSQRKADYFKKVEKYLLFSKIGEGQYGQVYRSTNSETGEEVAVKVVSAGQLEKQPKLQLFVANEVKILTQVEHPHVVKLYDVLRTPNNLYFVYELCEGGTLEDLLKEKKRLGEEEATYLVTQILAGFVPLTRNNILHRDIKPGNVFLKKGKVKIGDFGFCKQLEGRDQLSKTQLGSPLYMAPEVLFGNHYDLKADIWSIGVIYYELLYGLCPFETNNIADLINKITQCEVIFPPHVKISNNTKQLIKAMLVKDPQNRIEWGPLFKAMSVPMGESAPPKFAVPLPKVDITVPMQEQDYQTVYSMMIKPQTISDLKSYQYFLHEQRNKLNFMLEIFKLCLSFDEINTQYRIDLIKLIYVFQQLLGVVMRGGYGPLGLGDQLKQEIAASHQIQEFMGSVEQENKSICGLCLKFMDKNKRQNGNYDYQWVDYHGLVTNTFTIINVLQQTRGEDDQALVVANLLVDVLLLDQIFHQNNHSELQYDKYFTDIRKLENIQLKQILTQKKDYIHKSMI